MKATGIVRRIDDLGRVVIPKEIRKTLRIHAGDPLEIYLDKECEVILKKYSPIADLGEFAKEYTGSLHEATGHIACITDRDAIISVSGAPKKEFINTPQSTNVEKAMESRKALIINDDTNNDNEKFLSQAIAPIISGGGPIGAVILGTKDKQITISTVELKLAETAAGFLAKQMDLRVPVS